MDLSTVFFGYQKSNKIFVAQNPSSAYLYYAKRRVHLLTGKIENKGIDFFFQSCRERRLIEKRSTPLVVHLSYELGAYLGEEKKLSEDNWLAIEIEYQDFLERDPPKGKMNPIELISHNDEQEKWKMYQKSYSWIQEQLKAGNCYQINYTQNFHYSFKNQTPQDFLNPFYYPKKILGPFAHASYIPFLNKLFVSNSPEALAQYGIHGLQPWMFSMPIKGTMTLADPKKFKETWQKLKNSAKDQGELYMIADLARHDLASIDLPRAQILKKKYPLKVPGLLHQFSLVGTPLSEKTTLYEALLALFPGASITGAPKKKVMEFIEQIESEPRGMYCGSTLFWLGQHMDLSLNIRSAEIDFTQKKLRCAAGGGITLLSRPREEWRELKSKLTSFLSLYENC